jgi:hypothetical protein
MVANCPFRRCRQTSRMILWTSAFRISQIGEDRHGLAEIAGPVIHLIANVLRFTGGNEALG